MAKRKTIHYRAGPDEWVKVHRQKRQREASSITGVAAVGMLIFGLLLLLAMPGWLWLLILIAVIFSPAQK